MSNVPAVVWDYIEGLKTHDVDKVASTVSEDLAFISAGRTLDKSQFLDMLKALYTAFPDWRYEHSAPELREGVIAIKWRQGGSLHRGTGWSGNRTAEERHARIMQVRRPNWQERRRGNSAWSPRFCVLGGGAARGKKGPGAFMLARLLTAYISCL